MESKSLIHIKGRRGEKRGGEQETGEQKQVQVGGLNSSSPHLPIPSPHLPIPSPLLPHSPAPGGGDRGRRWGKEELTANPSSLKRKQLHCRSTCNFKFLFVKLQCYLTETHVGKRERLTDSIAQPHITRPIYLVCCNWAAMAVE